MAGWNMICEVLCERLKKILDDVGVKESDRDDFFASTETR